MKRCVITGCIARNLLPHPSTPGHPTTRAQQREMTRPYADLMATRIKGKPLLVEHAYELGATGEVLHSWVDDNEGWMVTCLVDDTLRGSQISKACASGVMPELSLGHDDDEDGIAPREVSIVKRGAREKSHITKVQLLDERAIQDLRQRVYKPSLRVPSEYLSADFKPPKICCSFTLADEPTMQTTHAALRIPQKTEYASGAFENSEISNVLNHVEQTAAQMRHNTQPGPSNPNEGHQAETEESLLKKLVEIRKRKDATQVQSPQDQQFNEITNKLRSDVGPSDPNFTGNSHVIMENPLEQGLPMLMQMVNRSGAHNNILKKDELDLGRKIVTAVAATAMQTKDELEKTKAECEKLRSQLSRHEKDVRAASADAAQFLESSGMDKTSVQQFVQLVKDGDDSSAMKILLPAAIQCSERIRQNHAMQQRSGYSLEPDDEAERSSYQLQQILRRPAARSYQVDRDNSNTVIPPPRLQASKRTFTATELAEQQSSKQSNRFASGSGTWGNSGVNKEILDVFDKLDRGLNTTDKFAIPEPGKLSKVLQQQGY